MPNDDFEVISSPMDNKRALEIFFRLVEQKDSIPLAEIKKRTHIGNDFLALLSTATDLVALDSNTLFRKKEDADSTKILVWLSSALNRARHEALSNSGIEFRGLTVDDLRHIAKLSSNKTNLSKIKTILLQEFGIVLVFEKSFHALKLDGIATKLTNGIPVIGLSLRYPRYDYFWFTLLHELAHISLHYDQLSNPILDDMESEALSEIEVEANRLAADAIVPRKIWNKADIHRSLGFGDHTGLLNLAHQAMVHPALVAGLLRRKNNNYTLFSKLINEIDTRKFLGID